jgi:hypothetical protein
MGTTEELDLFLSGPLFFDIVFTGLAAGFGDDAYGAWAWSPGSRTAA